MTSVKCCLAVELSQEGSVTDRAIYAVYAIYVVYAVYAVYMLSV